MSYWEQSNRIVFIADCPNGIKTHLYIFFLFCEQIVSENFNRGEKYSLKTFHNSSLCYTERIPTKFNVMFQRPVPTISNKTFCCQRKHSYVAAVCSFWCVCSNNESHPCQPSRDCHCTQPSLTPSWGLILLFIFQPQSSPKFSFHFVLFCLHCGQVGMPAYIWTYKCMYVCI